MAQHLSDTKNNFKTIFMKTKAYPQSRLHVLTSAILFFVLFVTAVSAQETKQIPLIHVSGEGKVKVTPDQALISVTVETKGNVATDVKKQNDASVEKVIQYIRKANLPKEDVMTQRVALNPQYDYEKKKYYYIATQTIEIFLKDLNKYDALMAGLVDSGINRINNVEFKSSKMAQHQSDARKLAITEAKLKAQDYVSVLGQKVGEAHTINDNTQIVYPQQMYMARAEMKSADSSAVHETAAIGEINITANVSVSFVLD